VSLHTDPPLTGVFPFFFPTLSLGRGVRPKRMVGVPTLELMCLVQKTKLLILLCWPFSSLLRPRCLQKNKPHFQSFAPHAAATGLSLQVPNPMKMTDPQENTKPCRTIPTASAYNSEPSCISDKAPPRLLVGFLLRFFPRGPLARLWHSTPFFSLIMRVRSPQCH